jgi:ArsR family transcriptional regulator, arsenate/arsenite/antimonite-responsive transcriptional repressor
MANNKKNSFDDNTQRTADFAKALSHPARIEILRILAERNTCICGEIVLEIPLAQSTVSQHLKELKNAGLITGEIDGPRSCYCLNSDGIREMAMLFGEVLTGINIKKCKC